MVKSSEYTQEINERAANGDPSAIKTKLMIFRYENGGDFEIVNLEKKETE